ncbi:MAG: hypothetical protein ABJJ20_10685 [Lentilitoribacter sp.]
MKADNPIDRSISYFGLFAVIRCDPHEGLLVEFGPTVTLGSGSCDVQQQD